MQRCSTSRTFRDMRLKDSKVFVPQGYCQSRATKIFSIKRLISASCDIDRTRQMRKFDSSKKRYKGSRRWINLSRTRIRKTTRLQRQPVAKSSKFKTDLIKRPPLISSLSIKRSKCRQQLQKNINHFLTILERTMSHLKVWSLLSESR